MPAPATEIDAGGRALRVSNPDREIFPQTPQTKPVTKLEVVQYYVAVAPGIMRALRERPTTLERWPKGVHPGIVLSTREQGGGDAFFQKRVPRGAPDYVETASIQFPSGRSADEIAPTEIAVVGVGGADGHDHLPSMAGAARRRRPPRRAAPRPRSPARHGLRGCRTCSGDGAGAAGRSRLCGFPEDVGRARRPHICAHRAAVDLHRRAPCGDRLRAGAGTPAPGRGDDEVVEGGARREHLRGLQPERPRPHDRVGLQRAAQAGSAGVGAGHVGRAARRRTGGLHCRDDAGPLRPGRRSARDDRRRRAFARAAAGAYERQGDGDMPYPPDYPKMPGEPKRVQPSRDRDRK